MAADQKELGRTVDSLVTAKDSTATAMSAVLSDIGVLQADVSSTRGMAGSALNATISLDSRISTLTAGMGTISNDTSFLRSMLLATNSRLNTTDSIARATIAVAGSIVTCQANGTLFNGTACAPMPASAQPTRDPLLVSLNASVSNIVACALKGQIFDGTSCTDPLAADPLCLSLEVSRKKKWKKGGVKKRREKKRREKERRKKRREKGGKKRKKEKRKKRRERKEDKEEKRRKKRRKKKKRKKEVKEQKEKVI
jgi:hypothetical protein